MKMGSKKKAESASSARSFKAPEHVSEIFLPSGPVAVKRGIISLEDPSLADVQALRAAGCSPLLDVAEAAEDQSSGESQEEQPPAE
jgi:hypothetical protein